MAWAVPENSKSEVDRAGRALVAENSTPDQVQQALLILNNWRSSHSFPLNTFQVTLRARARQLDGEALIAQRIKRMSSIEAKLARFPTMKASQMQDIGGCRAVMRNVTLVRDMVVSYEKSSIKHKLLRYDDYLTNPKSSSYRGVHLIYRYYSDRSDDYNGLLIEVQLRSLLQHAWATAVETVGTFLKQSLKSSQGHEEWLRFFVVMSSLLALRERTNTVPGSPTGRAELIRELKKLADDLDVQRRLQAYGDTLRALEDPSVAHAQYFLMVLDPRADTITIRGFIKNELDQATAQYLAIEKSLDESTGAEAVLVSVDSIAALKRAYPNYFLDTRAFLAAVQQALR